MTHLRTYLVLALFCLLDTAWAGDLYKVIVMNKQDAARLRSTGVEGVVRLSDGFLVLADSTSALRLSLSGLQTQLVMPAASQEELGLLIDHARPTSALAATEILGEITVVRMPESTTRSGYAEPAVFPLADERVSIEYLESRYSAQDMLARLGGLSIPLEELISRVSRDSLEAYEQMLATFYPRFTGTATENQARDWLAAKLASFGIDSVSVDSFGAVFRTGPLPGFNVVGYKFGHTFPNHYVIVGAHRDAGFVVPINGQTAGGADDNGSGTVAVLEMARILSGVETDMTIVFALFDAEEEGLFGAKCYARGARARGDSVVCMLNLDMIGDINNFSAARIHRGQQTGFSDLFVALADSLLGLYCLEEDVAVADHLAFYQAGYEIAYLEEYNFSSVYHTIYDDTTHLSYDYLTLMTRASLAAVYAINATAWPSPTLAFQFPGGVPSKTSPSRTTSFEVSINPVSGGVRTPGSETLRYSIDGSPSISVPLTPISPQSFRATLPVTPCGSCLRYYVTAVEATRGMVSDVDTAIGHFALSAGSTEIVFSDDFETDKGWSVTGSATTGHEGMWQRGFSAACGFVNDPLLDFDNSGQSYYTGNSFYYDWSSLIGRYTELTSPAIGLTGRDAVVTYAAWYSNHPERYQSYYVVHEDTFDVQVSVDGNEWTRRQTIGPVLHADGGWYTYAFRIPAATPGSTRLRFVAQDEGSQSLIEAAIDAVEVIAYDCADQPSCCSDATGNVNMTGVVDLSDLSALVSYLSGGGYVLPCVDAANVNGLGIVDLADLSALVSY
ncbi:hypothetical protein C3F09_11515, partial [candidate division GN15 bacterium]